MSQSLGAFDIVVVGAGMAGALIAASLAEQGRTVLMLDAGLPPELSDDTAASSHGLVEALATEDSNGHADYRQLALPRHPHTAGPLGSSDVPGGGSTWPRLGSVPRMLPGDFAMRSRYGVGVDWPIGYGDLEPWYGRAEEALGVAGNHEHVDGLHGAYRTTRFPLTEIWPSHSDLVVERALAGKAFEGVDLTVLRTPLAHHSNAHDRTVFVKQALTAKVPAQLRARATVTRIVASESGVVRRVEILADGRTWTAEGRAVVVAAHAIETPRLLLASGLANRSGQVGRNLMDHATGTGSIVARMPMFPFPGPPSTSGIEAFRDGDFRRERAAFRLSLGNAGPGLAAPPEGAGLRPVRESNLGPGRRFQVNASTEILPDEFNAVRLREGQREQGLPAVDVYFSPSSYTRAGYLHAEKVMRAIFEHVGFVGEPPRFDPNASADTSSGHFMGTCRMGSSPSTSVVDADCRTHDHPNLFIAGASLFTTGGTASPTLTVVALALRLAAHLQRWLR